MTGELLVIIYGLQHQLQAQQKQYGTLMIQTHQRLEELVQLTYLMHQLL